jgi:adenine-specific DNA-methyltransferase
MKKRLQLAKRLLKPDGVLIVTIDDNENHHLLMLLEEVMPDRATTSVVIVQNPRGNVSNNFAHTHEYAHFLIGRGLSVIGRTVKENLTPRKLRRWGHFSTRKARPTMFYPIYAKDGKITRVGVVPPDDAHPKSKNVRILTDEIEIWPIDQEGVERRWNFSLDTINDELGRIIPVQDENGVVDLFLTEEITVPKTVWTGGDFEAGKHGASLVKMIVEREFPFPKSLYAVKKCIELVVGDRPNAIVLDFFGGSATTLHATCLLNSEDGGQRRCILVTNNEVSEREAKKLNKEGIFPGDEEFEKHGICESIAWPRSKYAVLGKRDSGTELEGTYLNDQGKERREMKQGFDENIEYFKLDFLDPDSVAYGDQFEAIIPILWLMAGAQGDLQMARGYGKWFIPKHSPYAVLIKEAAFADFKKALKARPDITHVFLVTDSEEAYREMIADLPGLPHTKMLYKSYLDNFRINLEQAL